MRYFLYLSFYNMVFACTGGINEILMQTRRGNANEYQQIYLWTKEFIGKTAVSHQGCNQQPDWCVNRYIYELSCFQDPEPHLFWYIASYRNHIKGISLLLIIFKEIIFFCPRPSILCTRLVVYIPVWIILLLYKSWSLILCTETMIIVLKWSKESEHNSLLCLLSRLILCFQSFTFWFRVRWRFRASRNETNVRFSILLKFLTWTLIDSNFLCTAQNTTQLINSIPRINKY